MSSTLAPQRHLTSTPSGVRIAHYDGAPAVRAVGHELSHLDRVAVASHGRGQSSWLEHTLGREGFRVTTASLDGRLVGYAAGSVAAGYLDLDRVVVVAPVLSGHPAALDALVDAFVDRCDAPWADIRVAPDSLALTRLLTTGWRPAHRPGEDSGRLVLTGQHAH